MLLRLTPWRRGPLLLLRRPGVALALVSAAFVATLPAAAAPLFLSSAQNATLHRQIGEACPWQVGVRVTNFLSLLPRPDHLPPDYPIAQVTYDRREKAIREAAAPELGPQVSSLVAEFNVTPLDHAAPEGNQGVNLIGQDFEDFGPHIEVLEGPADPASAGPGVWIPDNFARTNSLKVGDRVRLVGRPSSGLDFGSEGIAPPRPYDTTVVAIFRDLRSMPDQPYWCSLRDLYRGEPGQEFSNTPILPLALVDTTTFIEAGVANHIRVHHTIEYAVDDTTPHAVKAGDMAANIARMHQQVYRADPDVLADNFQNRTTFTSILDRFVRRADLVRKGLLPPVIPITAAGVLVGLAVVAAASMFWVQRRHQELTVLAAHGVGAGGLGLKAVTEAVPAVIVGAAAGWGGALALVRGTGPSTVLSPYAIPLATVAASLTAVISLVLIGVVASMRARALTDQAPVTHRKRWWMRLPWELLPIAAAPIAWLMMDDGQTIDTSSGGAGVVAHVPARLLVVPILAISGAALLAGRLIAWRLRTRGLRRTPAGPTQLLAWRRIVRDATTTAMLAAATAVPIAMATYGASVTDSIRTTTDAEVRLLLGSDAVASLQADAPPPTVPPALAERTTELVRINGQNLSGLTVDLLVVDPATVTKGAFWDDRMPGDSLADAAKLLTTGPQPRIVVSGLAERGPTILRALQKEYPVDVVDVRPLPGSQAGYPVVLIHRDAIDEQHILARRQLWIRGDPEEIRAALGAAKLPLARITTINELRAGYVHESVTYTFQYLIALSIFTGLIAVVGLLLYLESRTATHRRAYVLLRRFGLKPGQHRRALLLELGVPVLVGLTGGLALAGGIAYALRSAFEIDRLTPPGALLVLPTVMIGIVAVTAVAVSGGAASLAHRRVRRANPSEVLRDTP